jgi:hypothetical protein
LIDVQLARKIVEGLGLELTTPDEAREILDLRGGDNWKFDGSATAAEPLGSIAAKMSHLAGSPH